MTAFVLGTQLKQNDLRMIVTDPMNPTTRMDAFTISYSLYQLSADLNTRTLIAPADRQPARFDVGHYYVGERIDPGLTIGEYSVEWRVRRIPMMAEEQSVSQYSVVGLERIVKLELSPVEEFLVHRLRILLRDNNPDRYYKFQPPTSDARMTGFTEYYGFIWQDDELQAFLDMSLHDVNMRPPETMWHMDNAPMEISTLLLVGAAKFALSAVETMWVGEEFNYSINGISLDVEKSSKYSQQKDFYKGEFDEMVERYKASINIVRGLRQPYYSVGLNSHLGPFARMGIQSMRNFAGGREQMNKY